MKIKNYQWGTGQRKTVQQALTVQQAFVLGIRREPYPQSASRMEFLKFDKMIWQAGRKPNRIVVGTIRAMGAQHFFRGCYLGAEND